MANDHFLVATDERFPITVALDHAFATGQISPELVAVRKQELIDLASEAAKTLASSPRRHSPAPWICRWACSPWRLVAGTKGEPNPNKWAARVGGGWLEKSRQGSDRDDAPWSRKRTRPTSTCLRRTVTRKFCASTCANLRYNATKRISGSGHRAFADYRESRELSQRTDTIVRFLIRSLVKRNLPWIKDPIDGPTCADEAFNTLLFAPRPASVSSRRTSCLPRKNSPACESSTMRRLQHG